VIENALNAGWFVFMQKPWKLIAAVLFLIAICSNLGANYYYGKWLGFGFVFSFLLGISIGRKYGWAASALVVYLLGNTLWFLLYPGNRYAPVQPYDLTALKLFMAESGFKLLLILSPLLVMKVDWVNFRSGGVFLSLCFTLLSLGAIFLEFIRSGCVDVNACGGLLANPSMNASMMAVTLPFIFQSLPLTISGPILLAMIAAVLLGKTSLGLGMIVAFLCLYCLSFKRIKYLLLSPFLLGLGWYSYGAKELLSSGDRFQMWEFFMTQWTRNPIHWWFGTGYGTFGVFSINLQNAHHFRSQYWWVWMHNDWLEMIFTTGLVGFSLLVSTYATGLWKLWRMERIAELQSLLLFGLMMATNYPLRIGLTCAFGAWLILLALHRDNPHNQP
jgi:hypothetical protein